MKEIVVGMGFYKREQWERLLETADDAVILERSYDEWLGIFDSAIETIKGKGAAPELVMVDVEELLCFCREKGLFNNAKARALYVSELVRRRYGHADSDRND